MRFLRRGRKPEGWAVHTVFRSRSRSREWRSRASGRGFGPDFRGGRFSGRETVSRQSVACGAGCAEGGRGANPRKKGREK
ncbi:MAG TPA: hypothetical protein DCW71_01085 [Alistipes sp.]|nr:hypothetical protein [Alistipes sp.]